MQEHNLIKKTLPAQSRRVRTNFDEKLSTMVWTVELPQELSNVQNDDDDIELSISIPQHNFGSRQYAIHLKRVQQNVEPMVIGLWMRAMVRTTEIMRSKLRQAQKTENWFVVSPICPTIKHRSINDDEYK